MIICTCRAKKEASTNAYYKAMKIYETNGVEQYDPRMTNLQNKLDVTDDKINPLQHTLSNEDEVEVRDEVEVNKTISHTDQAGFCTGFGFLLDNFCGDVATCF
mmetsp:Transcript_39639/g.59934  ORF Transcript_39639/g.59934 Transcript_39639/m.59934 type:complete len:103 (-) Transcript_39639:250-558(-)